MIKNPAIIKGLKRQQNILEHCHPGVFAIEKLAEYNTELILQLAIVCDWLEVHAHQYCKCENNGDYCDFHSMLADAKEACK